MKKEHQLISIAGLLLATTVLLTVIFVRYYENDEAYIFSFVEKLRNVAAINNDIPKDKTELKMEEEKPETGTIEQEESEPLEFVPSDKSYFDDALFIGDSRCVGIGEYGTLENATFFAITGMSIYNLWDKEMDLEPSGKTNLKELLEAQSYSKIYIMLGFNELGYNQDYTAQKYKETLDIIHELEPDAIIYICSNLHVTEEQSTSDETFNNENIDLYNKKIEMFADQETFFYLDVNEKFNDDAGNLNAEYSGDHVHLFAKHYEEWSEWFCQKTICK